MADNGREYLGKLKGSLFAGRAGVRRVYGIRDFGQSTRAVHNCIIVTCDCDFSDTVASSDQRGVFRVKFASFAGNKSCGKTLWRCPWIKSPRRGRLHGAED